MKCSKPVYASATKAYTSDITNGVRFDILKEDTPFTPSLEAHRSSVCDILLAQTQGWFTKPLTSDWLLPRIEFSIPTDTVPTAFEGTVTLQAVRLVITKEQFVVYWKVVGIREAEKVVIDFQEGEEAKEAKEAKGPDIPVIVTDVPLVESPEPVRIGPTRRVLQKRAVLEARSKAARALFKAEHMTQQYIQVYGEDTDWEEDEEEEEEAKAKAKDNNS
jgi:hypothetical protein